MHTSGMYLITISVSNVLTLFVRYRPGDLKPNDVQNKLAKMQSECGGQMEPLLKLFLQIRSHFQPVMRHYFTEKHKTPISWFAMRLSYTRSVATTSIVGHSLGLGDRHVSNILIDNGSGEVVHIDLGIAFDQVCCFYICYPQSNKTAVCRASS